MDVSKIQSSVSQGLFSYTLFIHFGILKIHIKLFCGTSTAGIINVECKPIGLHCGSLVERIVKQEHFQCGSKG